MSACKCERTDVLCGCGWGRMGIPQCQVPETCPTCGFDFWQYGGVPEPCKGKKRELPKRPCSCGLYRVRGRYGIFQGEGGSVHTLRACSNSLGAPIPKVKP